MSKYDLIKTIDDDEEVENFSDNSEFGDDDVQPHKEKSVDEKKKDFDTKFTFVSDASEYNKDTWNDLNKYIKRKAKFKLDDKIKRVRREQNVEEHPIKVDDDDDDDEDADGHHNTDNDNDENGDGGIYLSDDEMKKDTFKTKERKGKKKNDKADIMDFEETATADNSATFYQMNLSRPLLKAITTMNYVQPTPIQAATIPVALMGRDICGCAATGTGKTAAYMLPTLERLLYKPVDGPAITRVVVLVPTRELGVQVYQVTKQLSQFTNIDAGLAVGGLDIKAQEAALRRNPDIIIASPGRLIDHIQNTPNFTLNSIEVLIIDEADRMFNEDFETQLGCIVKECSRSRQTMLFSATMTEKVKDLAAVSLDRPVKIFVDSNIDVAFNLRQEFIRIRAGREKDREAILAALICRTFRDHTIVFVQTKKQAHRLHIVLGLLGIQVGELHGNISQPQRLENLRKFKDAEVDVLVATDVAARGLDISGIKTVINFVMPATLEHYIHRVGRTARAGRVGVSVSLAGEEERVLVKKIIKNAKNPVKNRIIAPDIIEKYNKKLESLEPDVEKILQEQKMEKEIAKIENQTNRAEKLLQEEEGPRRNWFQTSKERKLEKDKLKLTEKIKSKKEKNDGPSNLVANNKLKKKKKEPELDPAEARALKELEKVAAYQARLVKRKGKMKKIRTVIDDGDRRTTDKNGPKKRSKSSFTNDLTDTSKKGVKRLRYDANKVQRETSGKVRGKSGAPGKKPMSGKKSMAGKKPFKKGPGRNGAQKSKKR
ncbi:probable ATP-dependent RNA helicase DDX27 [Microplitis demolitor]|uniref:probable ATP-dependent RNA helicase DDX27 n=1 Tax=Microplitis demolitor TaxID=69319 RepID=UPI0004CCD7FC|nr:probable ATP-dependent RNA helicase DDX27 [Microplitis demolitor]